VARTGWAGVRYAARREREEEQAAGASARARAAGELARSQSGSEHGPGGLGEVETGGGLEEGSFIYTRRGGASGVRPGRRLVTRWAFPIRNFAPFCSFADSPSDYLF
jgi:hypothetical protein